MASTSRTLKKGYSVLDFQQNFSIRFTSRRFPFASLEPNMQPRNDFRTLGVTSYFVDDPLEDAMGVLKGL